MFYLWQCGSLSLQWAGASLIAEPGFWAQGLQCLLHTSSAVVVHGLSGDRAHVSCIDGWILNHWTTREVLKLRLLRWNCRGLCRWVLNSMTYPYQKTQQPQQPRDHSQILVMQPHARETLEPSEAGSGKEQIVPLQPLDCSPADTLISDVWPPELWKNPVPSL